MYLNRKSDLQWKAAHEGAWYQQWADELIAAWKRGESTQSVRERFPGDDEEFDIVLSMARRQSAPLLVSQLVSLRRPPQLPGQYAVEQGPEPAVACEPDHPEVSTLPEDGDSDENNTARTSTDRSTTKEAGYCLCHDHGFLYAEDYVIADGLFCAMNGVRQGSAEDIVQRILSTWVSKVGRIADINARSVFAPYTKKLPAALVAAFLLEQRLADAPVDVQAKYHGFLQRMLQNRASDATIQDVRDALKTLKKIMLKQASRSRREHVKVVHVLVEGWNAFAEGKRFMVPELPQAAPYGQPKVLDDLGCRETP